MRLQRATRLITWPLLEPEQHADGFVRVGVRDLPTKRRPSPTCMIWTYHYHYLLLIERECWEEAWSDLDALRGGVIEIVSGCLEPLDEFLDCLGARLLRRMPVSRMLKHLALEDA